MFQLRRNRVLVVLVLMSIFVVTTQAFTITSEPVIVDWQYDSWDDDPFITVASSNPVANSATNYNIDITFSNSDTSDQTRNIRVELLSSDGTRVLRTGAAGSDPDIDAYWLVAEQVGLDITSGVGSTTTNVFSFVDVKVEAVITGGGYFMVYTNELSTTWTSGNYVNAQKIHLDIDAPDYVPDTDNPDSPSGALVATNWDSIANAYDDDIGTFCSPTATFENVVDPHVIFEWSGLTATDPGPLGTVDITVTLAVLGFHTNIKHADFLTIAVYVDGVLDDSQTFNVDIGTEGPPIVPVTITFPSLTERAPGDGWSMADIATITVEINGVVTGQVEGSVTYNIYDVSLTITPP